MGIEGDIGANDQEIKDFGDAGLATNSSSLLLERQCFRRVSATVFESQNYALGYCQESLCSSQLDAVD